MSDAARTVEAITDDRWRLRGAHLAPTSAAGVCAVLGHAMMVDRRTLDRPRGHGLASTLCARGIDVLELDVRGHGESGPSAREGGQWSYEDIVRHDVPTIVALARARFPHHRVVVVGHSLVGHAALFAAGAFPDRAPDAIVALAANVWLPHCEPSRRRRALKGALLAAFELTARAAGRFPTRVLRMGTDDEPVPYVREFRRIWRADAFIGTDGTDYTRALTRVRIPVLAISSRGDRLLAHPAAVTRFLTPIPRQLVTHRVVDAGGHMALVSSIRSAPVWHDIADWLLAAR